MRIQLSLIGILLLILIPLAVHAANLDEKTTTYYLFEGKTPSGLTLTTKDSNDTKGWTTTRALTDKSLVYYTDAMTGDITGGTWMLNLWYKRLPAPVTVKAEIIKTDAKGENVTVLGTATIDRATDPQHPWHHTYLNLPIKVSGATMKGDLLGLRLTKTSGGDMEIGFNANDYNSSLVMVGTAPFTPLPGGVMNFTFRNCTNVLPDSAVSWTFDQKTWHPLSEGLVVPAGNRSAARMYLRLRFPDAVSGGGSREYADFMEYNLGGGANGGASMLPNTTQVDALVVPFTLELVDTDGRMQKIGISESQPALIKEFLAETPDVFHDCVRNNRIYQTSMPFEGGPDSSAALERNVKMGTPDFHNPDKYYQSMPCNMYAKFVHAHSIDGRAYGFPYDDDCEQAAYIASNKASNMIVSIYWMDKGAKLPTVAAGGTGAAGTTSTPARGAKTFDKVNATAYDDMGGAQNENADTDVGFFDNEDWIVYNDVKFDAAANAIDTELASDNSGGTFEFRIDKMDGPAIGKCTVTSTGGWGNWQHVMVPITPQTGTHTLYVVGTSGAGICNFNSFSLVMVKP